VYNNKAISVIGFAAKFAKRIFAPGRIADGARELGASRIDRLQLQEIANFYS
jgi:hypothetical protein